MRIGRAVIIPALVALGMAGSILAGSAVPVATVNAASAHVYASVVYNGPGTFYHT